MTDRPSFFSELKRRNVYKVAVAYAVVGWLVIQVSATVLPTFHAPEWVVQTLVVLVAVGFPIALVIAWAFELTPEGIKRTEDVDPAATARQPRKHTWIFVVIVGAAISVVLFFVGRYTEHRRSQSDFAHFHREVQEQAGRSEDGFATARRLNGAGRQRAKGGR
jgi:hypothetical protein